MQHRGANGASVYKRLLRWIFAPYKVRFYKKLAYGANSIMSDLFYIHLMDTDYVAECLTVFHGNGAAIDRIRTDFTSGCSPST